MRSVLEGRDSLVILPTGGGKSLCFQAPALAMSGTAVVVSPLISLMKDQVDALRELGIPAGKLHSGQPTDEARAVSAALRSGELRLLYVSPERLVLEGFVGTLKGASVSFLAVDEAHCVSEWGHDFRPEYRQLQGFRASFPQAALHAYTATATPRVAEDISKQLGLRNPSKLIGSFDRPNLFYRVEPRPRDAAQRIAQIAKRHKGGAGIVYCISRKDTEKIAGELNELGLKALPYHAGLSDIARSRHQDQFINDQMPVVVATVAFGMGIDKPDVRYVIHAGMPKTLENYQQESGRAGRDGLAAECVLLYSGGDITKWSFILQDSPPAQRRLEMDKIRTVENYCAAPRCRRATLLEYFGEAYGDERCNACDVCTGGLVRTPDSGVIAQKILSCVKRLKEEHGCGYTARILLGKSDEATQQAGHDQLSTFGLLKDTEAPFVRGWIEQLIHQGYLLREGEREGPLRVTPRGWKALKGEDAPQLMAHDVAKAAQAEQRNEEGEWDGVDKELFDVLRALRTTLARERKVAPYMVFGDRTLRDLARLRPITLGGMHAAHGIGDAKLEQYGQAFLGTIVKHVNDQGHSLANAAIAERAKPDLSDSARSARSEKRALLRELLRQAKPIAQAVQETGITESTVLRYLIEWAPEEGWTATHWLEPSRAEWIAAAIKRCGTDKLKPIFESLNGDAEYWEIRLVLGTGGLSHPRLAGSEAEAATT